MTANKFFKPLFLCLLINIFSNVTLANPNEKGGIYDAFGRLIYYPGKVEVACPVANDKLATILVIGQSNAANHGVKMFVTKHPDKVFNYFNGKCYVAASPLLGATGEQGEFITPLADQLIEDGVYESVMIISSAIGGTPIAYWQKGWPLNLMLQFVLNELTAKYKITEVIWHQGESDFYIKTSTQDYTTSFNSLISSIRAADSNFPPIYYAIATKCGEFGWYPENPVAIAQRNLANDSSHVYLGVDTDSLLLPADRNIDQCHFSESGQLKTAQAFAQAIRKQKTDH